ncbi:MAG: MBL fold metallo-hydrolase [Calditrichaeota bacterium]|nr:MAG: MBL fold metallo-hydrolase [Calditrichota bacterium]
MVAEQLRATGGVWLSFDGTNIWLDPGPGALVKALSSRPRLNPKTLDGVLLSHRHIDHCNDINVVIEAMTDGGFKKRGVVFAPADALGEDAVIFRYVREYVQEVQILTEKGRYELGSLKFEVPVRHHHPHETYGFNFYWRGHKISWVIDTKFFPELLKFYDGEVLVLHCVRYQAGDKPWIQHLNLNDVRTFLEALSPRLTILTHFGRTMLTAKPWVLAEALSQEFGLAVRAASDGWKLQLQEVFPEESEAA